MVDYISDKQRNKEWVMVPESTFCFVCRRNKNSEILSISITCFHWAPQTYHIKKLCTKRLFSLLHMYLLLS